MKKLLEDVQWFLRKKIYMTALLLTTICSYGFSYLHPVIGIDDTMTDQYFRVGRAPSMGRWTLFLLDKVLHFSDFAPFFLEVVGSILMVCGVLLFSVLYKRILKSENSIVYTVFACIFVSFPFNAEDFLYYGHNGVGLGYVLTALALLFFAEAMDAGTGWRMRLKKLVISTLLLWVAVGCYESFLILYAVAVLSFLVLRGFAEESRVTLRDVLSAVLTCFLVMLVVVVLRTLIIALINVLWDLQTLFPEEARGFGEVRKLMQGEERGDNLFMLVKRYVLVYFINAVAFRPVRIYALSVLIFTILALILSIRRQNAWYVLLELGMVICPFLLTLVEAKVTYYRTCQYMPLYAGLSFSLLLYLLQPEKEIGTAGRIRKGFYALCVVGSFVLVFNQAELTNRIFYMDYCKYESVKEQLTQTALEIERDYGKNVPVIFTGTYEIPFDYIEDFYIPYGSREFAMISRLTDWLDPHLKEKYYTPKGYTFAGEAQYGLITWGFTAYDQRSRQLVRFLEMHGHSFQVVTDEEVIDRAWEISEGMPRWPQTGSITQQDGYVLVHY